MADFPSSGDTGSVESRDTPPVLDRRQFREVTLDDESLMRELLAALIQDTEQQLPLLASAIRSRDAEQCARLAHYSKGACSNIGAKAAAAALVELERQAKRGDLEECGRQLSALAAEIDRLRAERV